MRIDAAVVVLRLVTQVVVAHDTDMDAAVTARQLCGREPRIFHRFVEQLQQDALLRVHLHRLTRRDAEEPGVETLHVVDEPAEPAVRLARLFAVGIEQCIGIPACFGNRADTVFPVLQQAPECIQGVGTR